MFESNLANLVKDPVDELQPSQAANAETHKEVERQMRLVLKLDKKNGDAFNDVASSRERVTAANTREPKLPSNASAVSDRMARATAEVR